MFLVLGLFATPSQFLVILLASVLLGLFLIFVARPLAVWFYLISAAAAGDGLHPVGRTARRSRHHPLLGGLENGRAIFNTAFIIVLVSLIVQADGRLASAAARPDRAAAHRAAGEGRAGIAWLGAPRAAGLYRGRR